MTKPPELLPCPFCGCETVEDWSESTWPRPVLWTYCAECNAKGPPVMMQRNEKSEDWLGRSIAAWNKRTPAPAVQALVEAAREMSAAFYSNGNVTERHAKACRAGLKLDAALAAFDKAD